MKVFLLIVFCISSFVYAQIVFDPVYNLSNTMSATSDYHAVYSENTDYYVVWGDNGEIMFKHSSDYGTTWGANKTLSYNPGVRGWPVIVSNGNHLYAAYHNLNNDYSIIFQHSTDKGLTWSTMQTVSNTASQAITPQITFANGNVYLVWEQKINNVPDIFFVKSSDNGNNWSEVKNISNSPSLFSRWVQLISDNSALYCAWIEGQNYPLSDIYFSKSTDDGNTWTTPINITNDDRPQSRLYMTSNSNGTIYIASDDIITFNHDEIYLLKSTDGGNNWSPPVNITNNPGNSNTPCLFLFGDNIYFTWSDNSHTAPSFDNSDIFFKWSSDGGITWNDSTNISGNPESSSRPRFCTGINGPIPAPWLELTIVWYDYSTGNSEILARHAVHPFVPVELINFTADAENNMVNLSWTTASETNNKGFEVERKQSMVNTSHAGGVAEWSIVGFMHGNGTSTEVNHYSFKDENLSAGKYIYRLKQIDFDGSFEYSNEIEVDVNVVDEFVLYQNYPNPFNPSTVIRYSIPVNGKGETGNVSLKIYDVLGNEIAVLVNEQQAPGEYEIEFDAAKYNLSSGVYYYRLNVSGNSISKKMIYLK